MADEESPGMLLWALLDRLETLRHHGVKVPDPSGTGRIKADRQVCERAADMLGLELEYVAYCFRGAPLKQARAITYWIRDKVDEQGTTGWYAIASEHRRMLKNWCRDRRGMNVPDNLYFQAIKGGQHLQETDTKEAC